MREQAAEHETAAPERGGERAPASLQPAEPGSILMLQRAAGNAAVAAMLQRCGGARCKGDCECDDRRSAQPGALRRAMLQRDWDERQPAPPLFVVPWAIEGAVRHFSSEIDITAIPHEDIVDWVASATRGYELEVDNITDMVDKVLAELGPTRKIKHFWIDAHGSPGSMHIGTDYLTSATLPTHSPALRRLVGRFSPTKGRVTLAGCNVAASPAGVGLLRDLAALLGVPVRGGSDTQRPLIPGLEGPVTRCTPSTTGGPPTCATE